MIDWTGKTCLVTGATGGIGSAIVRTLHALGATIVAHYAQDDAGAKQLAELGARVHLVRADLATRSGASTLFHDALRAVPRVDVLVNNAGIMPVARLEDDLANWQAGWDQALRVNLCAVADLCREAILHYRAHGGGIVVNVASRAAFRGDTLEYMNYAASKAGVVALTRSIARGCGRENILAYTIAPGFVDTKMVADFVEEFGVEAITRDIPLGEMAPPEEVARVVAFVGSGLARHATGSTIDVNGASYVR